MRFMAPVAPCHFKLRRLFPFCRNWKTAVAMSILSGFLSGCHSRRSKRNSFARASFGSTFFITVSLANTCFLAWAISGGSRTGADCTGTAAPAPVAAPAPAPGAAEPGGGSAVFGGDLRKRLERLRLLARRCLLDDELLEELDFERLADFFLAALERLLLERLLELLFVRLFLDLWSLVGFEKRDFTGDLLRLLLFDRRLLAELLLELLREDLLERLVAADFSEPDSSESRNFFGASTPKQRRSFLP